MSKTIYLSVRTSGERDLPDARERTSARARITGVLAGASNPFERTSDRRRADDEFVFLLKENAPRSISRGQVEPFSRFVVLLARRGVPPEWKAIRLYRIFHSLERAVVRSLCGSGYRGRAPRTATSFDDGSSADSCSI